MTLRDMYDVVYIDAHGAETPVAQQLGDRKDAADVARQAAAERGVGRMVLPGSTGLPPCGCVIRVPPREPPAPPPRARFRLAEPLASCAMRVGVIGGGLMGS